jgi:DNA ligase (NAD+)
VERKRKRIMSDIIKQLKNHDFLYSLGIPEISDTEYDKLRRKAQEQFPDHEYFKTVGHKPDTKKTQLPFVLGSLNKVKSDSVVEWMRKTSDWFVISEKVDGVSIYVVYVDGKVEWAATRGDGYYGQDITDKAKIFCPELKTNIKDGVWCLRGEATLNINPKIIDYKTKRNGCAGILNSDGLENCQYVSPYFYEIIESPLSPHSMATEWNRMTALERLVEQNMPKFYSVTTTNDDLDLLETLSQLYTDAKNREYDVDGLVITISESVRENVEYPEKKMAFKVNEEAVEATVEGIAWQITRTGRIVPVVLIKPLELQGVTVHRVTGHNYEYVSTHNIKEGTKIGIVRSGDVIPYITEVISENGDFDQYVLCPSCGYIPKVKGVDLVCENELCGGQIHHYQEYWLRALGAEGISHKTLEKIGVETIPGLYEIDEFDIMVHEGFGVKRANQVYNSIQKTLRTDDKSLLRAMGMPGIGRTASKALINYFGDIYAVLEANENELEKVDGIGYVRAKNIKYNQARCLILLKSLERLGLQLKGEEKMESNISGMLFSMTGKLPMKRDLLVKLIESKGGQWKNSVTKKTDFLITNNPQSTSGKMRNANKYGTRVISFDDLMRMIGE